jgi:hypothetical protein
MTQIITLLSITQASNAGHNPDHGAAYEDLRNNKEPGNPAQRGEHTLGWAS